LQIDDYHTQKIERTLFHEVMHAIDDLYLNSNLTEDQIDALSNGIYAFLKDNKLLK